MDTLLARLNTLDKPPKLMYKPPHRDEYIEVAAAFDELFNRLAALEEKLNNMETK